MNASATDPIEWFATCPKGVESLLADELASLGAAATRGAVAGVHFSGTWALAYRVCLWSRLANRVLWPLRTVDAADGDRMYASLRQVDWGELFAVNRSIAVDFSGTNRAIRNSQFGAQRAKDAVVDWFNASVGRRPDVDRNNAAVRINIRLQRDRAQVSLDLAGHSLHRRGYRQRAGAAPLKENLAAAILLRADWPGMAARGGALIDPMCGSGTLLLEAAMMAADIAPGLACKRFAFEGFEGFERAQWQAIRADAVARAERGRAAQLPEIRGYDADPKVIRRAIDNIARAGLERAVRVSCRPLAEFKKPTHRPLPHGMIVTNPPYGERLGDKHELAGLYRLLGQRLVAEFPGWLAAVFTSELSLGKAIGLRSHKRYTLYNGAIATYLLLFDLHDNTLSDAPPAQALEEELALSEGARMFANRLQKNRRRLQSWRRRQDVECYRLYDADMPEYAVAIDCYGDHVHVAEYKPPATVSTSAAERRLQEVRQAIPVALEVAPEQIVFKQRVRQRGSAQYTRQANRGERLRVREGRAKLLVNLHDYIDTGLFLDHRPLRLRIAAESHDKDFLNLFCYTGSATVHAALAGARSTTSVDLSRTYLSWLRDNLAANGITEIGEGEGAMRHQLVRADCQQWLQTAQAQFDLVLLDPPSFSNSKSTDSDFDVQRDHPALIRAAMARLRDDGSLYFSNNRRNFRLDAALEQEFACTDISAETIDKDFERNPKIHRCWLLQHRGHGG